MNAINKNNIICDIECIPKTNDNDCQKAKGVEIAFSLTLFVSAIFAIWQASSLAISIATLLQ